MCSYYWWGNGGGITNTLENLPIRNCCDSKIWYLSFIVALFESRQQSTYNILCGKISPAFSVEEQLRLQTPGCRTMPLDKNTFQAWELSFLTIFTGNCCWFGSPDPSTEECLSVCDADWLQANFIKIARFRKLLTVILKIASLTFNPSNTKMWYLRHWLLEIFPC